MEIFKNITSSLSYGQYHLVPNCGTFWWIFPLYVTFCGFHCFHFHCVTFFGHFLSNTFYKNEEVRNQPERVPWLTLSWSRWNKVRRDGTLENIWPERWTFTFISLWGFSFWNIHIYSRGDINSDFLFNFSWF